jgi:hypothetical protein
MFYSRLNSTSAMSSIMASGDRHRRGPRQHHKSAALLPGSCSLLDFSNQLIAVTGWALREMRPGQVVRRLHELTELTTHFR